MNHLNSRFCTTSNLLTTTSMTKILINCPIVAAGLNLSYQVRYLVTTQLSIEIITLLFIYWQLPSQLGVCERDMFSFGANQWWMNQLAQRTRAKHLLPKLQAARSNDETDGLKAPSKAKKKSSVSEKSNLSKARTVTKRRRVSWVRRPAGAGAGKRHHLAPLVQPPPPPRIKVILLPYINDTMVCVLTLYSIFTGEMKGETVVKVWY